ncbi:hypothetical protein OKA04_17285 [Luteolibacter flavescens]|uniref:PEP-CTERM sorting domain-containing protein n=1 Tax=Luteolibacter flavescens TaxID=1859460 RepID=A0ABT3FU33_9BACT|nr:hypothetical protein [Luteolibacter flavescens]MCW1886495.1 hypothetical protein [Luteolibacter flavescens]
MKPNRSALSITLALGCLLAPATSTAALVLINGNFQDTTGLGVTSPNTWLNGIPTGWSGVTNSYTVGTNNGGTNWIANLDQVSSTSGGFRPLYQDLGTLDETSTISMTFTVLQPWNANLARAGAAIWSNAFTTTLDTLSDLTPGTYTLTAENVAAGTAIRIGFWRSRLNNAPGIDDVSITVTPVPEPQLPLLVTFLTAPMLLLRKRRRFA